MTPFFCTSKASGYLFFCSFCCFLLIFKVSWSWENREEKERIERNDSYHFRFTFTSQRSQSEEGSSRLSQTLPSYKKDIVLAFVS